MKEMKGGADKFLYITLVNLSKNLIEAGLLSPAGYFAARKSHSHENINAILGNLLKHEQSGGRMAASMLAPRSYTEPLWINKNKTLRNKNRVAIVQPSNSLKKLNKGNVKVNSTRRNNTKIRTNDMMPTYSDDQIQCFYNELISSSTGGKINEFYAYYIQFVPMDLQKELLNKLFFVPLADSTTVQHILEYLNASEFVGLLSYLDGLKSVHLKYLTEYFGQLNLSDTNADMNEFITHYIGTPSRYGDMLDFCDKIGI
jgi:hypothetical protein